MSEAIILGPEDKTRLKGTVDAAIEHLQEMADRRESLSDLVKTVAKEFNMKPGKLMKYIKAEYSNKLDEMREEAEMMENLSSVYHS